MDQTKFLNLPVGDVASLMQQTGSKVCVFPINGTRRWFLLQRPPETWSQPDFLSAYHSASVERQLEIYDLFFSHGIDTLVMPLFGPDLLERGPEYVEVMAYALKELATGPVFTDYYRQHRVRIRFYGDHRRYLANTPYAYLSELFDQVSRETAHYHQSRLFYGVFGNDATESVANLSIQYFQQHGHAPDRKTIIERYYGEYVAPVSLFIGFDRFSAFDMPLIATGNEDLYFTVSPSFYMTQDQLRAILYDHLFARRVAEQDYELLAPGVIERMRAFYELNQNQTLGVGRVVDGFWYPLSYVRMPETFLPAEENAA